jgi:hypothetical protein
VFTLIGVLMLALGAGLFYIAATTWPIGPMTYIVGFLLLAYVAVRIRRTVLPKEKRLSPAVWAALRARRASAAIAAAPVVRIEDIVSQPGFRAEEARQRASGRRIAPFLLLAGVGLLALAAYLGRSLVRLEALGLRAPGVVQSLDFSRSGDSAAYYPLVTFTLADGRTVRFKDRTGTNPPSYRSGDAVTVLYLPDEPQSAIIDHGLWNSLPPVLVFLSGALLCVIAARSMGGRTGRPDVLSSPPPR